MTERTYAARAPRITFTLDFHELLRGDLAPGSTVTLRYDPLRIVPPGDGYVFGDPNRPIVAHAIFKPGELPVSRTLQSPSGMLENPDVDATGNGNMLVTDIAVPQDAREAQLWFTYTSPQAGPRYDSDDGCNFHFGFPRRQIRVISADVSDDAQAQRGAYSLRVAAVAEVERLVVRLRLVNDPQFEKTEIDLQRATAADAGWPVWALGGVAVPRGAIVQYKLYYWIDGIRYKEDNDGLYYLAPQPKEPPAPPPPPEIAAAARRWA
jgi:hypothetical protein